MTYPNSARHGFASGALVALFSLFLLRNQGTTQRRKWWAFLGLTLGALITLDWSQDPVGPSTGPSMTAWSWIFVVLAVLFLLSFVVRWDRRPQEHYKTWNMSVSQEFIDRVDEENRRAEMHKVGDQLRSAREVEQAAQVVEALHHEIVTETQVPVAAQAGPSPIYMAPRRRPVRVSEKHSSFVLNDRRGYDPETGE